MTKQDTKELLQKLDETNFCLKQIVACLEKRLAGHVLNFDSAEHVKNKEQKNDAVF